MLHNRQCNLHSLKMDVVKAIDRMRAALAEDLEPDGLAETFGTLAKKLKMHARWPS